MNIMSFIAKFHSVACKIWRRGLMYLYRPLFASYGRNCHFDPYGTYSFGSIFVGDDVYLGLRPMLMAAKSKIIIGSHVMFGPEVMIIGGDHNTSVVGKFMCDVEEKRPGDDQDVIIEDDVWIGARAIILKGVTIGRGSIVASGSVVTKSVAPYSVVAGVPGRAIKRRWDAETIIHHEEMLYPPEKRLSSEELC